MRQIQNLTQNKEASRTEHFFICNNHMVRLVDSRWNQIYLSLYLLQEKLASFGLIALNDEIAYEEDLRSRNG